jgi:TPR repeat protein
MYASGQGVPRDYVEAAKWYRLAADQGDALAETNLGLMYNFGDGVPQDYAEAVKWYRLGANHGDALAQTDLGLMYAEGQGVAQDFVQAEEWFTLAASRIPATEKEARAFAIKNRDALAAKMTPGQLAKAAKLAQEWKPK